METAITITLEDYYGTAIIEATLKNDWGHIAWGGEKTIVSPFSTPYLYDATMKVSHKYLGAYDITRRGGLLDLYAEAENIFAEFAQEAEDDEILPN